MIFLDAVAYVLSEKGNQAKCKEEDITMVSDYINSVTTDGELCLYYLIGNRYERVMITSGMLETHWDKI